MRDTMPREEVPLTHRNTGDLATAEDERIYVASQWQLMWWRFRKHRLACVSALVILLFYAVGICAGFFSLHDPDEVRAESLFVPPQRIHFFDGSRFSIRPYVLGWQQERDPVTLEWLYTEDPTDRQTLLFFAKGYEYQFWGIWECSLHFIGTRDSGNTPFLLGTDRMGRDVYSRIVYGTRISMSIGLVGVTLSLTLGILIGGISGYYGGTADMVIQRVIEFVRSIPSIPLWMSLAAALPLDAPPLRVYFLITVLLSLIGWTGMARVVRGRFLALRSEDFVMAARIAGSGEMRIILRHMLPSFTSHIIASITLSIPAMILSETSLSFLGLGLRPPVISWGVLLQEAQNVRSVALAPWLLIPGAPVVIAVLGFNFLGDGLRDAADPYAR